MRPTASHVMCCSWYVTSKVRALIWPESRRLLASSIVSFLVNVQFMSLPPFSRYIELNAKD